LTGQPQPNQACRKVFLRTTKKVGRNAEEEQLLDLFQKIFGRENFVNKISRKQGTTTSSASGQYCGGKQPGYRRRLVNTLLFANPVAVVRNKTEQSGPNDSDEFIHNDVIHDQAS
jgi:hypothetical protein